MKFLKNLLSPKSARGAFILSIGVHVLVYASIIGGLAINFGSKPVEDDYLDLGYEVFDAPPVPATEERLVRSAPVQQPTETKAVPDDSPKEMQEADGEVAGRQQAQKQDVGAEGHGNASSTPYYKIKPKYPKAAAIAGVEGSVMMTVDINEDGSVDNVRVTGGEQTNMFEKEARRAVALWKYRPFLDASGKPYKKVDHQVVVEFKLTDLDESASAGG